MSKNEKTKKKSSIFIKIVATFVLLSVLPVAISGFLTVSTYQEIFNRYQPYVEQLDMVERDTGLTLGEIQRNVRIQVGLIIFLVVILSTFVSILLTRQFSEPLRELVKGTKAISAGKFDVEIKVLSRDELGDLAESFNEMAKDLSQSHQRLEKQRDALNENVKILAKRDTELSLANIQLQVERDKTASIIQNLTDGLIVINTDGKITDMNPRAEEIVGIALAKVRDKKITGQEKTQALINLNQIIKARQKGASLPEIEIKEPFEATLQIATAPVKDERGNLLGIMKILHDITRDKAIDRMKSEFISVAAHQLRTPVSAIKWTLKMILDGDFGKLSKEQQKFLARAYQSNERMITLINDLLDVSRIEEGRFLFNLGYEAIEHIIENVIEDSKHTLAEREIKIIFNKPTRHLPKIYLDAARFRLALQNIVDNAIVYNKRGGTIAVNLSLDEKKKKIILDIQDTGVGVPKKQLGRLFTKFFRADNVIKMQTEGTGLGLFIARNIIKKHGGDVTVESQEDKGTTVRITLPIKKEESKKK